MGSGREGDIQTGTWGAGLLTGDKGTLWTPTKMTGHNKGEGAGGAAPCNHLKPSTDSFSSLVPVCLLG